jgi:hypothetical protein
MRRNRSSSERFVDAVYRRLVLVRAAEALGVGLLMAAAAAAVLLPLASWRGLPTWPIAIFAGAGAVLIGAVRLVGRWPRRRDAVFHADSQLRFGELLITAMSPIAYGDAAFETIILSQADARCEAHDPSEIILRRMGVRSWSAVGLVLSLAVTLAIIPLGPARSAAVDANASVLSGYGADHQPTLKTSGGAIARVNDPNSDGASSDAMTNTGSPPNAGGEKGDGSGKSQGSTGGGSAGSESHSTFDHRRDQAQGREGSEVGPTAGGGQAGSTTGSGQNDAGGSTAAAEHGRPALPGAEVSGGKAQGNAVTPDRTPAEDRDLIRDFFAR